MASIANADVLNTERLPIDAQDIVSGVRLVIAGNRAGRDPDEFVTQGTTGSPEEGVIVTYFPEPITYVHNSPSHGTYRAVRSFAMPEGFNPFLAPDDVGVPDPGTVTNITNAAAIKDADSTTFATVTSAGSAASIVYDYDSQIVGFKMRYEAQATQIDTTLLVILGAGRPNGYQVWSRYRLTTRADDIDELYYVLPHDARNQLVNTSTVTGLTQQTLLLTVPPSITNFVLYEFYPLVLNKPLLLEIAKAQLRLPAALPQRVTVSGYVAPDREHTIVGWPGGDLTAAVAQHQYELGRTIIDFEQPGSPVGLPAEAREAVVAQETSKASSIETRYYPVKMAARQ